jgi:hypothetical protein
LLLSLPCLDKSISKDILHLDAVFDNAESEKVEGAVIQLMIMLKSLAIALLKQ